VNGAALSFTVATLCLVSLCGDLLLSIFGPEYKTAHHLLLILVASQVVRAICGPAAQVLAVFGKQQLIMYISVASFAVFAASCALLIPSYGTPGAAIAIALAVTCWNGANAVALAYVSTVKSYLDPFSKFVNSSA
jgi:O-antigen/teichoic acid export membrane protein